jgi:hypothetical protein
VTPNSIDKAGKIANAVLYEGYMLYPYRASSTKNQQRCTFGTLYPDTHPDVLRGAEPCRNQTQCLVAATPSSAIDIRVRFLQMQSRDVEPSFSLTSSSLKGHDFSRAATSPPLPGASAPEVQSWNEPVERTVELHLQLNEILDRARTTAFEFPSSVEVINLPDEGVVERIRKTQLPVAGRIRISAEQVQDSEVFRLTAEVVNATFYAKGSDRTPALLSCFVSAHTILSVSDGEFISLLDPPQHLHEAAAACKNIGLYPVLVGEPGEHDVTLSSPIILYDYPQVAPESAGDFFDATEMDEMLTLRVMTLTDDEKREMRTSDDRVRELLERTERTAREQLARTHGAVRSLRPIKDDAA